MFILLFTVYSAYKSTLGIRFVLAVFPENRLQGDEQRRHVKCIEEYLGGLLSVAARVERRLREQDGVLLGEGLELVLAVYVLPDTLHVVPVGHNPVLHGVLEEENQK